MGTNEDVIELLSDLMEDSDFTELMERANAAKNPSAVLEEAYNRLMEETDSHSASEVKSPIQERMELAGMTVEEIEGSVRNFDTGEMEPMIVGYDIKIVSGNVTLWMGKTLSPCARHRYIPFGSRGEAIKAAVVWMDLQDEKPKYPPVSWFRLRVPFCRGEIPCKSGSNVSIRLSAEEVTALNGIVRAMRAENLEVDENKPVDCYNKAVRYIIKDLIKQL
jgi:hypothetical protein